MNYSKLIEIMNQNPGKELAFAFESGLIRKDYHITEVLKTQVEAIDCGGAVDSWKETVLQLLEPKNEESERFMTVKKAMEILVKSDQKINLVNDSKVVLEYRPRDSEAAQRFTVSGVEVIAERIVIQTQGTVTQCKAAVRKTGTSDSCGAPKSPDANQTEKVKSGCCS
jgi:hypothetical protein